MAWASAGSGPSRRRSALGLQPSVHAVSDDPIRARSVTIESARERGDARPAQSPRISDLRGLPGLRPLASQQVSSRPEATDEVLGVPGDNRAPRAPLLVRPCRHRAVMRRDSLHIVGDTGSTDGRICSACKTYLPASAFRRDPSKKDGLYPRCKPCTGFSAVVVKVWRRCPCGMLFNPRRARKNSPWVRHCSRSCAKKLGNWTGEGNALWTGDQASYAAIHQRLAKVSTPQACLHCGSADRRLHWALDHGRCSNPKISDDGLAYSTDLSSYIRLCVSCHSLMDRAHRSAVADVRL